MSWYKSWTSQAHSRCNIIETTKSFLDPQRGWSCLFYSSVGICISAGIYKKMRVVPGKCFPVVKQSHFTSTAARLKVHLLHVMCLYRESWIQQKTWQESEVLKEGCRPRAGGGTRGGCAAPLCLTWTPSTGSITGCAAHVWFTSASQSILRLWGAPDRHAVVWCILAQTPHWLHTDHFSLGSFQCKHGLGLYAHFSRGTDMADKKGTY